MSYLFPILPPGNPDHLRYKRSLARHNARLKRIGQTLRLPNPFTSYVVRHSWASEALRCDMPMALISQALGHSSEKTTRFYLEELDISRLAHANMKVIGSVNRILEKGWMVCELIYGIRSFSVKIVTFSLLVHKNT